jgi:cellulose synthase/poly-beta-1,6-N-acetylglucosamine synthase-like glycosyltransferase
MSALRIDAGKAGGQDRSEVREADFGPLDTAGSSPDDASGQVSDVDAPTLITLPRRGGGLARSVLVGGLGFVLVAMVAVAQAGPWTALFCLGVVGAITIARTDQAAEARVVLLAVCVGLTAVDYVSWRFGVINWSQWYVGLPLFLAELFAAWHTVGLHFTIWPRVPATPHPTEDPTVLPVFVLIPTVDEGTAVLEPTIRAALATRAAYLQVHPHACVEVVVCNDGLVAGAPSTFAVTALAQQLGVRCVTRSTSGGAKAGNLEHARQLLGADGDSLVVIFDADQVADPEFLCRTIPHFADRRIGWVQTGQYYRNLDNPVARWANDQQSLFYAVLCPGKSRQNAAFICGTNVVIRARALDEIGGLPTDSVTEDFAASIRLHSRWRSVFVPDRLAEGLGPLDLDGYFRQQSRWARGTLGVLGKHWRDLVLPRRGGLSAPQRLQYALASTHYLCGIRDLIFLLAPMVFVFTGLTGVQGATLSLFLWHFVPYLLASQLAFWHVAHRRTSLRGILIGFLSFPTLIAAAVAAVRGKRSGFAVTPKHSSSGGGWRPLAPHLLALVVTLVALVTAVGAWRTAVLLPTVWLAVMGAMLVSGPCLFLTNWQLHRGRRARPRLAGLRLRGRYVTNWQLHRGRRARPRLAGLRLRGRYVTTAAAAVGAIILASHLAEVFTSPTASSAAAYDGRLRVGVALPSELLGQGAAEFTGATGLEASVVGRSEEIREAFDLRWAEQLTRQHGRIWINLSFARDGRVTPDSGLRAVANGVHDRDLQRWARAIRQYGQPVYLTVLQHSDRDWSASSGVANGGIPQDVTSAWLHIRSVFRSAGADNVVWLWAPADPANDAAYAPPASAIDGVVVTMLEYPRQRWVDPDARLAGVAAAHPGKPLYVEVAAAGSPKKKAAWLDSVAAAAEQRSDVAALVYHEGGPAARPTARDLHIWSVASDRRSLEAVRRTWSSLASQEAGS